MRRIYVYIYIYIYKVRFYSPTKVAPADLQDSYSVSEGGALSFAPIVSLRPDPLVPPSE